MYHFISTHLSPRSVAAGVCCHWWCPPFSAGHAAFLFICLPLSRLVSTLLRWPCSISIHVSPTITAGVRSFPVALLQFLFKCLPLSMLHPFLLAMQHLINSLFVSHCHCWCPPFSAGHAFYFYEFICLPLSLLVSALFRWPCCNFYSSVSRCQCSALFCWPCSI